MILLRQTVRLGVDLLLSGARTGRWWMPILVPLLGVATIAVVTTKVVVPTVVYVFF